MLLVDGPTEIKYRPWDEAAWTRLNGKGMRLEEERESSSKTGLEVWQGRYTSRATKLRIV